MKNYVVYHLHSDFSNFNATGADSVTKFEDYVNRAKELGMKAIAFSEHGNILSWVKKKQTVEKAGLKYIHANEIYMTETLDEKKRDNYHMMLIAKNYDGVLELNELSSRSYQRDGHYYYDPRLSMEEVMNTSDNIIVTSACLASLLWKGRVRLGREEAASRFVKWMTDNKHRCFFEVQYHDIDDQRAFNRYLYELHKETGVPLIAGTDTHALNIEHQKVRQMFMKTKGISYGDEDSFDLTFKSYDELVEAFEKQGELEESVYLQAIENTNVMANMVEEFELDYSYKYPKVSKDSQRDFNAAIKQGINERGLKNLSEETIDIYKARIKEEKQVYKEVGAIDYMLLQKKIIDWAKEQKIYPGYGRGSVSGSLVAYLMGITEMDSVKHNLNFARFMSKERISLADIDVDWPPSRRQEVIDYVASLENELDNFYFSEIITYGTFGYKGAITVMFKEFGLSNDEVKSLTRPIDEKKEAHFDSLMKKYRNQYPEAMWYAERLVGVMSNVGSHASGFVVSPVDLRTHMGTVMTSKDSVHPVSAINMKEIDGLNFVKLDILGLSSIELTNETCEMAGLDRLTPDKSNALDMDVWNSMLDTTLSVFQFESETAESYYRRLFNPDTITTLKKSIGENLDLMNLFSIGNAAIRPSGNSYRDALAQGKVVDYGHEALNNFLAPTASRMIFQEQIIQFLMEFCGYSGGEADLVRRAIGKKQKEQLDIYVPQIKERFIETMVNQHNTEASEAEELVQSFLQVINDASDYGFSINHSHAYSYIGYINAYLRHHYPLEFGAVQLQILATEAKEGYKEKTAAVTSYLKTRGITVVPPKFRYAKSKYAVDKEENKIFKDTKSIKGVQTTAGDNLYSLRDRQYNSFTELLVDVTEGSLANKTSILNLIKLNFFSEFGGNAKLLKVYEEFDSGKNKYDKKHVDKTKEKRLPLLIDLEKSLEDESLSITEQIAAELDLLEYIQTDLSSLDRQAILVTAVDTKYSPRLSVMRLRDGETTQIKMSKLNYFTREGSARLVPGDVVKFTSTVRKNKTRKTDTGWEKLEETELWLNSFEMVAEL